VTTTDQLASVRYLVDDVHAAVAFYSTHFGFTVHTNAAPPHASAGTAGECDRRTLRRRAAPRMPRSPADHWTAPPRRSAT
jgi:hypothetical protein